MKFVCNVCGYVYDEEAGDPDNGIAPGTNRKETKRADALFVRSVPLFRKNV